MRRVARSARGLLLGELDQAVRDALQPAVVSVWLRNGPETVAE